MIASKLFKLHQNNESVSDTSKLLLCCVESRVERAGRCTAGSQDGWIARYGRMRLSGYIQINLGSWILLNYMHSDRGSQILKHSYSILMGSILSGFTRKLTLITIFFCRVITRYDCSREGSNNHFEFYFNLFRLLPYAATKSCSRRQSRTTRILTCKMLLLRMKIGYLSNFFIYVSLFIDLI